MEPNDSWDAANPFPGSPITGHLTDNDVDCFTFSVAQCDAVVAELVGDCPPDVVLSLHDDLGVQVATGAQDTDGCPRVDPAVAPGARLLPAGNAAVCATGIQDQAVPGYTLSVSAESNLDHLTGFEPDLDDDALPDVCDPDRDGDGVANIDDNCPDISNGPDTLGLAPSDEGYLRDWLALAPILGEPSTSGCRASDAERAGGDANLSPRLGDNDGSLVWTAFLSSGDRLGFLGNWGGEPPPREVYLHTYVYSATARPLTLALGPDDGARAWVNGVVVHDIEGCQGTNVDQFQAPATLLAGWNRLTIKVRDQGGGWGLFARFLDNTGAPVTDLELSLTPDGAWSSDQEDLDGDGIGDVCDPTPAG